MVAGREEAVVLALLLRRRELVEDGQGCCRGLLHTSILVDMTSERRLISSGSTFEQQIGYSRAVVDGDWVFVSGTTGFDYDTMTLPEGIVAQTEQTFVNIGRALEKAGASFADVVRVNYVVPRRRVRAVLADPRPLLR